ncbi:glycosyltransferase involved in cell wall biosynthesis [Peribacillus simplex]|uniref:glycosyltransferase family 4 protein n=1 Tax=Peribacillus simplex TaxID=1478 RepID=UPI0024E25214|nr:glycosyltransferase family 4 protein [Peribacillus simplex]MDF9758869.1 glycosyltransferase involved in cell wall biosynthesis [Peribacillus simplex]
MRILHLNAGNETGGGMFHIMSLLNQLNKEECLLGVFEDGELYRRAMSSGIQTELFKQHSKFDLSILKPLRDFIRFNNIDIIHTHGPRANIYGAFLKRFIKRPWLLTVHSSPHHDFLGQGVKGKLFTGLHVRSFKYADHILAVSDRFKQGLIDQGIDSSKITKILNGIDFEKELPFPFQRDDFGFGADDFIIIMPARLEPVKGHEFALAALSEVVSKFPHVKLLLLGDGSRRTALEEMVSEKGLSDHVFFLGYREDLERIYPMGDVTLLTSLSESFPLVLLEGARSGLPAITSDVGGVKELIPDGGKGWITDIGNVDQLNLAICNALELKKSGDLTKIGSDLQKFAKNNFSIEILAKNVYNVYLRMKN